MDSKLVAKAIKNALHPHFLDWGFSGSFPHYKKIDGDFIQTITIQFRSAGGAFVIEFARDPVTEHTDLASVSWSSMHRRFRLGQTSGDKDAWFEYGHVQSEDELLTRIDALVVLLPVAQTFLRSGTVGGEKVVSVMDIKTRLNVASADDIRDCVAQERPITIPYFEYQEIPIILDTPDVALSPRVVWNFLLRTNKHADAQHVYAYFKDQHESLGMDALRAGTSSPLSAEHVWDLVTPKALLYAADVQAGEAEQFIFLEADCEWEAEHGLMMVWRNGNELVKVSSYDGHVYNEDPKYVYQAVDEKFSTYRDV